ncbi:MAG TPA: DUF438 domain-containing protein [Ignavibacteriaceae bacterium]|nr:DUF438 domain-containing protein [Ignavibacteriaceae bacterium]
MSEYINTRNEKINQLKELFKNLHKGEDVNEIRNQIVDTMVSIPYKDVVMAEEELMNEGISPEEILSFCDLHTEALKGSLDSTTVKSIEDEHPVNIFQLENRELEKEIKILRKVFENVNQFEDDFPVNSLFNEIGNRMNKLYEVEKHYQRKENLLFPFLERYSVTAPPKVMWGKHDQIRVMLKSTRELIAVDGEVAAGDVKILIESFFLPVVNAIDEMIYKEEKILFPMALDVLRDEDWDTIANDSPEIGFCLIQPVQRSNSSIEQKKSINTFDESKINLPSGNFSLAELTSIMNTLPFDMTFVDKDDSVRFFTQGKERIFARNLSIIGRKVQMCHPPSSVHIVEKILGDFKSGKENEAKFWIQMKGQFILISYYALRGEVGEYLGTLEVTQEISGIKKLEGERRILEYEKNESDTANV